MLAQDIQTLVTGLAREHGLEPAALLAVCDVESGGRVFATVDGRNEPLIRFEGHYFDRRLSSAKRTAARKAGLASPKAGAIANPRTQAARWKMLRRAMEIDRKAAQESVSWGLGQVMCAHWSWLGYGHVDDLVAEARSGAKGQACLMLRFIGKAGLIDALVKHDWHAFSRGYNGPAYRKHGYHRKLARAYNRYSSAASAPPGNENPGTYLKMGSLGEAVADLQRVLTAAGYPTSPDGVYGKHTQKRLMAFQRDSHLRPDGIAGPLTWAKLTTAPPVTSLINRLMNWLKSRF